MGGYFYLGVYNHRMVIFAKQPLIAWQIWCPLRQEGKLNYPAFLDPAECNAVYELYAWLIAVVVMNVFLYVYSSMLSILVSLPSSMLKRLVYHTRGLAYVRIQAVGVTNCRIKKGVTNCHIKKGVTNCHIKKNGGTH